MIVRFKYAKHGPIKYVGHLDMMRYFQKALRRAALDISYSQGYHPHPVMTFAAPLALGVTSDGEYFDVKMESLVTSKEMVERLNATMAEGVRVMDAVLLDPQAKTAMAVVSASDYLLQEKGTESSAKLLGAMGEHLPDFLARREILALKKSKKGEREVDIRPLIFEGEVREEGIYLFLSAGSEAHLNPSLVAESLCTFAGVPYNPYDIGIHRLETYMQDGKDQPVSLLYAGSPITEELLASLSEN